MYFFLLETYEEALRKCNALIAASASDYSDGAEGAEPRKRRRIVNKDASYAYNDDMSEFSGDSSASTSGTRNVRKVTGKSSRSPPKIPKPPKKVTKASNGANSLETGGSNNKIKKPVVKSVKTVKNGLDLRKTSSCSNLSGKISVNSTSKKSSLASLKLNLTSSNKKDSTPVESTFAAPQSGHSKEAGSYDFPSTSAQDSKQAEEEQQKSGSWFKSSCAQAKDNGTPKEDSELADKSKSQENAENRNSPSPRNFVDHSNDLNDRTGAKDLLNDGFTDVEVSSFPKISRNNEFLVYCKNTDDQWVQVNLFDLIPSVISTTQIAPAPVAACTCGG